VPRFARIFAIVLGGLVGTAVVGVLIIYGVSQRRMDAHAEAAGHTLPVPSDSATVARGEHVVKAIGMCADCHGADLGGGTVVDVPIVARLHAANLTAGAGGIGGAMSDLDWERAIRHGVAPDGRKLLFMPSHEYARLNDADAAAVIAYLKQLPKVARTPEPNSVGLLGRLLFLKGDLELLPADLMDQAAAHPAVIAPAPTAEYGAYLSASCGGCHGKTFSGGPIPGAPPDWKPPANITPEGIGHYSEADFMRALREGKRPDGTALDTAYMPVRWTQYLTDDELRALYAFLKTVPPKAYGGR